MDAIQQQQQHEGSMDQPIEVLDEPDDVIFLGKVAGPLASRTSTVAAPKILARYRVSGELLELVQEARAWMRRFISYHEGSRVLPGNIDMQQPPPTINLEYGLGGDQHPGESSIEPSTASATLPLPSRPFTCTTAGCHRVFRKRYQLKVHQSTVHNGVVRYYCNNPQCTYRNYHRYLVARHIAKIHNIRTEDISNCLGSF